MSESLWHYVLLKLVFLGAILDPSLHDISTWASVTLLWMNIVDRRPDVAGIGRFWLSEDVIGPGTDAHPTRMPI